MQYNINITISVIKCTITFQPKYFIIQFNNHNPFRMLFTIWSPIHINVKYIFFQMGQVVLIILQDNFFQRQTFICANPTNVYVEDNVSHSTKGFI